MILVYGFAALIAVGTFLLWLPFFNTTGDFAPFLTALFTATSAGTDTGLVVVNTATYWNTAGQVVILALLFIGGIGIMSAATFLLVVLTQRISLANQFILREFLPTTQMGGLGRLALQVGALALLLQLAGFAYFFWRFLALFSPGQAAWQAAFLSASAFNNAGFSILPNSNNLTMFRHDAWVLGGVGALIVLGGISYSFLVDVVRRHRFNRFTLDSRLVMVVTAGLLLLGSLVFFLSEFNNADTLKPMPMADRVVNSVFMSISPRTAGFNTIDLGLTGIHTNIFLTLLMFIGAASGSTGGGIKVNTLAVLLLAVVTSVRGHPHVTAFGREIAPEQIQRAMTVVFLGAVFTFVVAFFLVMTEGLPFDKLLFETVSAFGTVGLSTGITPVLSTWGKTLIAVTMYVGHIGPLTFALAMAERQRHPVYRYSQERVRIG